MVASRRCAAVAAAGSCLAQDQLQQQLPTAACHTITQSCSAAGKPQQHCAVQRQPAHALPWISCCCSPPLSLAIPSRNPAGLLCNQRCTASSLRLALGQLQQQPSTAARHTTVGSCYSAVQAALHSQQHCSLCLALDQLQQPVAFLRIVHRSHLQHSKTSAKQQQQQQLGCHVQAGMAGVREALLIERDALCDLAACPYLPTICGTRVFSGNRKCQTATTRSYVHSRALTHMSV